MSTAVGVGEGNLPYYTTLPEPHYVESGEWRDQALCRDQGNAIFFAQVRRGESQKVIEKKIEVAKSLCFKCPVRLNCLNYAHRNLMRHGIWGGEEFDKITNVKRAEIEKQLEGFISLD